jgi:hypothetical protein
MALPGMSGGGGLTSLLPVAMVLVGIVHFLRRRRQGRDGMNVDDEADRKRGAALEMERRMASYLAGRDTGGDDVRPDTGNGQENGR